MTMTVTSMLFAKIPQAHTHAHAKPDIQETDEPVLAVRRDIAWNLTLKATKKHTVLIVLGHDNALILRNSNKIYSFIMVWFIAPKEN